MSSATVHTGEDEIPEDRQRVCYDGDDIDPHDGGPCPVCGEELNHVVLNGYRNGWPPTDGKRVRVCTDDRPVMFVHVVDSRAQDAYENARIQSERENDAGLHD